MQNQPTTTTSKPVGPLTTCDPEIVCRIEADIIQSGMSVSFEDIAGLQFAKKCVQELICWYGSRVAIALLNNI